MSTLYVRATPRQNKVLRMIEGACRNAAHAHPEWEFDPRLVTSIAKRATGTLTAQWRDVLAAPSLVRSDCDGSRLAAPVTPGDAALTISGRKLALSEGRQSRGTSRVPWRAPLGRLHRAIGNAVGQARRDGQTDRAEALVDVLRMIGGMLEMPTPPRGKLTLPGTRDVPAQ